MAAGPTSLVSTNKASDSGLHVHLHPLVLLTVSDFVTRHALRRREDPIVGALLGQHNGRDVTLEHAFECQVVQGEQGAVLLHQAWFQDRLQQYKDVHKAPALELVGWFTTTPATGPEIQHVPVHQQILDYNETPVLLAFHPSSILSKTLVGGKLPLTIYESVYESGQGSGRKGVQEGGDRSMDLDGQEGPLDLKFQELPYSIETGEAEMIGVDFVARGGGNATNVDTARKSGKSQASQEEVGSQQEVEGVSEASLLSPEDEELISSLTARANAIKMLQSRVQLLKSYLTNLPPCYLTGSTDGVTTDHPTTSDYTEINHPILRSIQALINRLPLLISADQAAFEYESLAEKSDVSLVALLGSLTAGTLELQEMGRKFGIVRDNKQRRGPRGMGTMRGADAYEDADELMGNDQI